MTTMSAINKPFRPLTLNRPVGGAAQATQSRPQSHGQQQVATSVPKARKEAPERGPARKKRRVSSDSDFDVKEQHEERSLEQKSRGGFKVPLPTAAKSRDQDNGGAMLSKPAATFRTPLAAVVNTSSQTQGESQGASQGQPVEGARYFIALYRRFSNKKNKTWDGDGHLVVASGWVRLVDSSGKELGRISHDPRKVLGDGDMLSLAGREVQIESEMTRDEYLASRPSLDKSVAALKSVGIDTRSLEENTSAKTKKAQAKQLKLSELQNAQRPVVRPKSSINFKTGFQNPLLDKTAPLKATAKNVPAPRHDPHALNALVMARPSLVPPGKQVVDVVVDPLLTRHLRAHQREGVKFLYECVMGLRSYGGEGAILADEMGLGKTLQTIALLWTLLKQNPIADHGPVIKKALIVCPVTLIANWRKEFRKWLGAERVGVFVVDDTKKQRITDFTRGRSYSVMIIGYEKLRTVHEDLNKGAPIDIVIADEGHRLKTAKNKSAQAIKSLNTERRIILSGTPLQNDLSEFYEMVDFVNPGLLSRYSSFRTGFELPILKSRQPNATRQDVAKGKEKSEELAAITNQFILRRTADILSQYLPPKTEYVLFCRPTTAQEKVYRTILANPIFGAALTNPELSLQLITILKKVCNSPTLLKPRSNAGNGEQAQSTLTFDLLTSLPPALLNNPNTSSKLRVLDQLLHHIRESHPDEKVVLVSHSTAVLDMLGTLLTAQSYPFLRLDGSTPQNQRQGLIDRFNRHPSSNVFAFLLSATSGGAGLNLIGANRLIIFDAAWNPAVDAQVMARIHRDGQKRPCFIYRLLLAGGMDEKIFQRQVTKQGLADAVVDGKMSAQGFSGEELRDLFRLEPGRGGECRTHDLLGCPCAGRGVSPVVEEVEGDDGEEEEEIVPRVQLTKASEVDMEAQEAAIRGKGTAKGARSALMLYRHLDPRFVLDNENQIVDVEDKDEDEDGVVVIESDDDDDDDEEDVVKKEGVTKSDSLIEDPVLIELLRNGESRVDYIFAKKASRLESEEGEGKGEGGSAVAS